MKTVQTEPTQQTFAPHRRRKQMRMPPIYQPAVLAAPQTPEYFNLRFAGHEGGDFVFVPKP